MYRWAENGPQNVPKPTRTSTRDGSPEAEHQHSTSVKVASLETVAKRRRRAFSAAEKLRIVKEAARCVASGKRGAVEAMLRREGLYSSHLASWRMQFDAQGAGGLAAKKSGRKPKFTETERRNAELMKRNAELERKLHVANVLISLQKKAHELLGLALPESDGDS
jgi:transposase-like protein